MKTGTKASRGSKIGRPLLALCLLLPFLMGGCPEFRNDTVSAFETATQAVLFGTEDGITIVNSTRISLLDAGVDLVFDQLRGQNSN